MKINFSNLMLEVTRQCNMRCNHCLRGEARETDMDTNVIQRVFESAREIKHLGLTGGEPSLSPDTIEYICYYARQNSCRIGSFFCATNAKEYSEQFVRALNELYGLCSDKENCVLTISIDQFHTDQDPKALKEYRALPYYRSTNEKGFIRKANILSEGRAEKLGLGRFTLPRCDRLYEIKFEGFFLDVGDRVYVNALGDVLANADMSYEHQSEERLGNIILRTMDEILLNAMYEIPPHWYGDDDEHKCVFSIRVRAEAGTITEQPLESQTYYATAPLAAAAYHCLRNNLRITPMNTKEREIPDELQLFFADMDPDGMRCDGCTVTYLLPHEKDERNVLIELLRCPIEEAFDDVRE